MEEQTGYNRQIYIVDETKEKIIASAQKLFVQQGFFGTKMIEIAADAGISRGTLYRYFQDKTELAFVVVEEIFEWLLSLDEKYKLMESEKNGLSLVEDYIRESWLDPEKAEVYRYLAEFDSYFSGSRLTPEIITRLKEIFHDISDNSLVLIIKKGQEDGSIDPELNPHLTMSTIVNAIRGLHQRLLSRGNALMEIVPGELTLMLDEFVRYCLKGIAS